MNIYVWEYTSPVSDAWHNGGGILVVAESVEDARAAWVADCGRDDWQRAVSEDPDHAFATGPDEEPRVIVFPDAGCC